MAVLATYDHEALETAIRTLFDAYDTNGTGEIPRRAFLRLEIGHGLVQGDLLRVCGALPKMTLTDRDRSGDLDYSEFRKRQLHSYLCAQDLPRAAVAELARAEAERTLEQRVQMGPRFHPGIVRALRRTFQQLACQGVGAILPDAWVGMRHIVQGEALGTPLATAWVNEPNFLTHSTMVSRCIALELQAYMELSFQTFEASRLPSDDIMEVLRRVCAALDLRPDEHKAATAPLPVYVQAATAPPFQLPSLPGPTGSPRRKSVISELALTKPGMFGEDYRELGEVRLRFAGACAEDIRAVLRLHLRLEADTALSVLLGSPPPGITVTGSATGLAGQVVLLRDGHSGGRSGRLGAADRVGATLETLGPQGPAVALFVKNVRRMPCDLPRRALAVPADPGGASEGGSRRARSRPKQLRVKGKMWCLDWKTVLAPSSGRRLPVMPAIEPGDALVLRVPRSLGPYRFESAVHMDGTSVLSAPTDAPVSSSARSSSRRKRGGKKSGFGAVSEKQFLLVAEAEGSCRLFVEISWEAFEEDVAFRERLSMPVAGNSVGRLGPIDVEVRQPPPVARPAGGSPLRGSPRAGGRTPSPAGRLRSSKGPKSGGEEDLAYQVWMTWSGRRWQMKRRRLHGPRRRRSVSAAGAGSASSRRGSFSSRRPSVSSSRRPSVSSADSRRRGSADSRRRGPPESRRRGSADSWRRGSADGRRRRSDGDDSTTGAVTEDEAYLAVSDEPGETTRWATSEAANL